MGLVPGCAPEVPMAGQVMEPLGHGARVAGGLWESRVQACSHLLSACLGPSEILSLIARAGVLGAISVGTPSAHSAGPRHSSLLSSLPSSHPERAQGAAADLQQESFVSHTSPKLQNVSP